MVSSAAAHALEVLREKASPTMLQLLQRPQVIAELKQLTGVMSGPSGIGLMDESHEEKTKTFLEEDFGAGRDDDDDDL